MTPALVLAARAELGEGPLWDARRRRLLFVDIHQHHIHEFDPESRIDRIIEVGEPVSALALAADGNWMMAAGYGFRRVEAGTGAVTRILDVEPDGSRRRMNDGAVDPAGRFWAGSMSLDGVEGQGSLYCLMGDRAEVKLTPVTTSNGPAWSPDGRLMYYVDTRTRRIDVFDFDAALGTITGRREFVSFPTGPGRPDGIVVDRDGGVWAALWQGGAVHRYRPDGRLDVVVQMPTLYPTKCAFGGEDLSDLYITSAAAPLDASAREADPLAGGLFHLRPGFRGLPANLIPVR